MDVDGTMLDVEVTLYYLDDMVCAHMAILHRSEML